VREDRYSLNDSPAPLRSAADAIPQMKHPPTLNHDVGILQNLLCVEGPEGVAETSQSVSNFSKFSSKIPAG